jgi:hypothetical protein
MRVMYYIIMAANEDEETQRKGMVGVVVNIGRSRNYNPSSAKKIPVFLGALPSRWASVHYCTDGNLSTETMAALVVLFLGSRDRARFRKHVGTFQLLVSLSSLSYKFLLLFDGRPAAFQISQEQLILTA